jgi:hypothetical protein
MPDPEPLLLYRRDSDYPEASPLSWHVLRGEGVTACGLKRLDPRGRPGGQVPRHLRCRNAPCRLVWQAALPPDGGEAP